MKASTILSLAAATLVSAAPADGDAKELVQITDFSLKKTLDGEVTHVSFRLFVKEADNLLCTADNLSFPERELYYCGDSMYSFVLYPGTDGAEYGLAISHAFTIGYGWTGFGNVYTECHSAGTDVNDSVCGQYDTVTIGLS
ncbi:hypothetical protein E4U15_005721 [Claviceps sp. LM218 group G6]|nr:hypothetical protein E4U15_005721 [Claviceps sp. LM218 group G6]